MTISGMVDDSGGDHQDLATIPGTRVSGDRGPLVMTPDLHGIAGVAV